jgi:hypothetical protein
MLVFTKFKSRRQCYPDVSVYRGYISGGVAGATAWDVSWVRLVRRRQITLLLHSEYSMNHYLRLAGKYGLHCCYNVTAVAVQCAKTALWVSVLAVMRIELCCCASILPANCLFCRMDEC